MGTILFYGTIILAILDFLCGYYFIGLIWLLLVFICHKIGFFKRLDETTKRWMSGK